MIISVHLPKTAGISFLRALEYHFKAQLHKDYADMPINTPVLIRNRLALQASLNWQTQLNKDIACIHGHFMPLKYLLYQIEHPCYFITWMRHPVDRLISHYHFWNRNVHDNIGALHRKVIEERWSLEQFAFSKEMRNLYTQFLWGFPLEQFDFIGITEFYSEDFIYFTQQFLGQPIPEFNENRNVTAEAEGKNKSHYLIDELFRKAIADYHQKDMELYTRALAKRQLRLLTSNLN